ncbi:helix-turn-helix domain containing protein [Micromonospora sp. WMMD1102]|uniref:TetR/AcrR family transcriptional regulator n=1 Tax=Micromonospora sp. WMMD1102 TaxID=3016105 RepID=UPI002414D0CD|nr:TetR/AcrR family transcriptional regulator [Micromonospora sp. WMMD1102]MDG4785843.1 helix-turn-helix domain containing protein [Micromonospora sp. WMMD1102]
MRRDAEEKRLRILAAARHAFAEKGEDVAVARIARRAGVSVATVYRRFPTRDRLIADAYADQWNDCTAMHAAALRDPDPARALRELTPTLCAYQLRDRGFTRAYVDAVVAGRGLDHERLETERVVARLLEKAHAVGSVRADLTVADFRLLVAAHHGVILAAGPDAAAHSRRYLALVLRLLQA